ncbi:hypothetical protein [Sporosarcina sp. FSL K6-1508]
MEIYVHSNGEQAELNYQEYLKAYDDLRMLLKKRVMQTLKCISS